MSKAETGAGVRKRKEGRGGGGQEAAVSKGKGREVEHWGSRFGVVMAVAGSAVGLGNFLRFPGQAAQYGGGAFMVAYFVGLLLIGLPLVWVEWTLGRKAGQAGFHSSVGAFHHFFGGKYGKYLGAVGVAIPVIIFMYYVVIEAWCLGYACNFFAGGIRFGDAGEAAGFFRNFVGLGGNGEGLRFGLQSVGVFVLVTFLVNFVLIYRGISGGIELFCRYAMPLLVVLAFVILVRVLTLGTPDPVVPQNNVNNGLGFLWNPTKVFLEREAEAGQWVREKEVVGGAGEVEVEREALESSLAEKNGGGRVVVRVHEVGVFESLQNPDLWLAAVGQLFFSLSIGMGVILSYASYLRKNDDVVLSALTASSANEFCEVCLGGLITVPAGVAFLGVAAVSAMSSTFGLGFHALPMVFSKMPAGEWFGFLFFVLLFIAAVTSSISMLQPGIAFLEEALRLGRKASVSILGFVTAVGAFFVLYFSAGLKVLDTLDFWAGTFLIFVFAGVQVWYFGWKMGVGEGIKEANRGSVIRLPFFLGWVIRYVSPLFLGVIFVLWVATNVFGIRFSGGKSELSGYVIDLFVKPDLGAWVGVGIIGLFVSLVLLLASNSKVYKHFAGGRNKR